jgi:dihydrodipicolinate reductase
MNDIATPAEQPDTTYAADRAKIMEKLAKVDPTAGATLALGKKVNRFMKTLTVLTNNQAETNATVVDLTARLTKVEQLVVENGSPLKLVLATNGFTGEQIKSILKLQEDEQLTDASLMGGIVNALGSLDARVEMLTDIAAETRGMVNEITPVVEYHATQIGTADAPGALTQALTQVAQATATANTNVTTLREETDESFDAAMTSRSAVPIALVVGIVAGIIWQVYDWSGKLDSWNAWQCAVGAGLGAALVTLVVLSTRASSRYRSVRTNVVANRGNHAQATVTVQQAPAPQPQPAPALQPTQVLAQAQV